MWITATVDGVLEGSIFTPNKQPSEEHTGDGKWTLLSKARAEYQLDWNQDRGFVVKNFVRVSPDGRQLLENDKGREIIRATKE
jgi:hypothetical protein